MNSASAMEGLYNEILSYSSDKPSLDTKMIHRTKIHVTYSNSNEYSVVFCKHYSKLLRESEDQFSKIIC
jgi:hypothetical protein